MMKKLLVLSLLFTPLLTAAQTSDGPSFTSLFVMLRNLVNLIIPLLIAAAVMVFLFGILMFIVNQSRGNDEKAKAGKQTMLWGIIGLFVMVSVWGLVNILVNSLNLDPVAPGNQIDQITEGIPFATNCSFDYPYYHVPTGECATASRGCGPYDLIGQETRTRRDGTSYILYQCDNR